jgi:hypothetical protein
VLAGPVLQLDCDLNALRRRSSSDLISLSSFLRSSSAFRLTRSRTGSQLLLRSRSPFASEGSLLLISTWCCLLISRAFFMNALMPSRHSQQQNRFPSLSNPLKTQRRASAFRTNLKSPASSLKLAARDCHALFTPDPRRTLALAIGPNCILALLWMLHVHEGVLVLAVLLGVLWGVVSSRWF